MAGKPMAALVRCGLLRTPAAARPAPSLFIYPGLTSRPYWDPTSFEWLQALLNNTQLISDEYRSIASTQPSDYVIKADEHTLHQGQWNWHSLVVKGQIVPSFQMLCPLTASLLQTTPCLLTDNVPFAYAFFSNLKPQAKIAAHFGPCNLRLRVHLPLIVPSSNPVECGIRVGGEVRAWEVGVPLVFDDTYEHETWNHTDSERVILLFDVWHPELSGGEREAVTNMFGHARQQGWLT